MAFHRKPQDMRRFYDGFHPWYRFVEGNTGRSIAKALAAIDPEGKRFKGDSVLEHCCGTGSLGLQVSTRCASYLGRDQSEGMLDRARERWVEAFGAASPPPFERESVLDFADQPNSYDRVMAAFAIHLFPPDDELRLLDRCARAARKSVVIIDHDLGFSPILSLVEAIEGGWYEYYKKVDFAAWARSAGLAFSDRDLGGARVMEFSKEG
jgi:ubiquinone/menaquinone biosynthesis C-methylase UbiE